jgi:hypothetical protein
MSIIIPDTEIEIPKPSPTLAALQAARSALADLYTANAITREQYRSVLNPIEDGINALIGHVPTV